MPTSLDLEALRANTGWMTRLARRLVGDADAEDLVQDAWMVALRTGHERAPSAGWLAGVVRNLARVRRRGESRRREREMRAARRGETGSTAELVERLAAERRVADAVLALPEPVREAILLRYYRGLALREIAERQGVGIAAAHRRVERGHALLRDRLARERGEGRRAWALAILPLTEPPCAGSAGPLGVLTMGLATKIAATVAVAGGALGVFLLSNQDRADTAVLADVPPEATAAPEPRAAIAPSLPAPEASRQAARESSRREAAPVEVAPSDEPTATAAAATVPMRTGHAIDLDGAPVPDLGLAVLDSSRGTTSLARTDASGGFAVEANGDWVEAREEGWTTVVPGSLREPTEPTVVAGRVAEIGGWVVDEDGTPVEGADLQVEVAPELYRHLSLLQPYGDVRDGWSARSDAQGRFSLDDAPVGEGLVLLVDHARYRREIVSLEGPPRADMEVVLRAEGAENVVWGTVVDPAGAPVEGAYVSCGAFSTRTDERGAFRLEREDTDVPPRGVPDGAALRALAEGFLPAVVPEGTEIVSPVELRLGGAPLSIRGRVVDRSGAPVPGAVLWLNDPTAFGMIRHRSMDSEAWISATQESILRGSPWDRGTRADAEGRFELGPLLDRRYEVMACAPDSFEASRPTPIEAGARDARVVVDEAGPVSRVAGRFVSERGAPIVGLRVAPSRSFSADPYELGIPAHRVQNDATTDEEGRVTFESLALDGLRFDLYLNGRFLPPGFNLSASDDPEDFVHVIPLPCRVQVDATRIAGGADGFTVVDVEGNALSMHVHFASFSHLAERAEIEDGLSSVVEVDERARAVVLWRSGEEVGRRDVSLDPEELNRVVF